jgi:hypothetical protein
MITGKINMSLALACSIPPQALVSEVVSTGNLFHECEQ